MGWLLIHATTTSLAVLNSHHPMDVGKEFLLPPGIPSVSRGLSVISSSLFTKKPSQGYYLGIRAESPRHSGLDGTRLRILVQGRGDSFIWF